MRIKDLLNQEEETPEKIEMEKTLEGRVLRYGRIKPKADEGKAKPTQKTPRALDEYIYEGVTQ